MPSIGDQTPEHNRDVVRPQDVLVVTDLRSEPAYEHVFWLRRRAPAQRVHVHVFASSQQESLIKRAARDMFNWWFDPDDKTRSVSKPHVISNNFEGPSLETTRLVIVDQVHTRRIPHLSGERPLFGKIDRADC